MFKSIGCYIKNCLHDIKRVLFSDKKHLLLALSAFLIGFLIALGKDYGDAESGTNFFYSVIREGETSPVTQIIRILLWIIAIYAGVFVTSIHFVLFIAVGYGGITLASYLIFSNAFKVITADTLCGTLYLAVFVIPVTVITFVLAVCAMRSVYALLNFSCNRKMFTNVACHCKSLKQAILPYFVVNLIAVTAYWVLIYVALVLIV